MSEADDLARRFLALWAEYLAALAADPQTTEPLRRWLAVLAGLAGAAPDEGGAAGAPPGPPAGAAPAAGAPGERNAVVAELARRVADVEGRVAALEERAAKRRPRAAGGARGRDRGARP